MGNTMCSACFFLLEKQPNNLQQFDKRNIMNQEDKNSARLITATVIIIFLIAYILFGDTGPGLIDY